jgi:hypothetical protein
MAGRVSTHSVKGGKNHPGKRNHRFGLKVLCGRSARKSNIEWLAHLNLGWLDYYKLAALCLPAQIFTLKTD